MTTTGRNFTMWQGETKTITVALINAAGEAYGSTAGLTFTWKVFATENSDTALVTKATSSGITNGTSQIEIALAESDTDDLAAGTYYHECRVVDGSGNNDVVFTGGLTLKPSPTVTV